MKKIVAVILLSFVFSCKKEVVTSEIETKWENCRELYDRNTTLLKLVGQWKYVAIGCAECSKPGITLLENTEKVFGYKQQSVEIKITADQKIATYKDGILLGISDFEIASSYNENYFHLEIKVPNENLYVFGIIEFCKDMLAFKNSNVDGADYYYERIK
jgi:hypothetical protein